jgi:2-dehydro-3-deoxygalactonokinase
VLLEDGSIHSFLTVPAGELFDLISRYSVLVHGGSRSDIDEAAFERGLAEFNRHSNAQLLDLIFQCRSRWMTGDLEAESTSSFLSGLLIASDIAGAMHVFAQAPAQEIRVIASSKLSALYSKGFTRVHRASRSIDGEAAALAGLVLLQQLSEEQ